MIHDVFAIRRAAVEKRIACFTSLDTARVAAAALSKLNNGFSVQPLKEYLIPKHLATGQE